MWAANGCCDRNPPGERGGKSRSPPGRPRRSRPAGDTWGRTLAHGRNRQPWRGCTSTSGSERSRKGSARPVTKGQRGVARAKGGGSWGGEADVGERSQNLSALALPDDILRSVATMKGTVSIKKKGSGNPTERLCLTCILASPAATRVSSNSAWPARPTICYESGRRTNRIRQDCMTRSNIVGF